MAPSFRLSQEAALKPLLHSVKHPTAAVCGLLVGKVEGKREQEGSSSSGEEARVVHILDAVPVSHSRCSLLPLLEIAMLQVEAHFASLGYSLLGFYCANERLEDNELPAVARRVGDQIAKSSAATTPLLLLVSGRWLASLSTTPSPSQAKEEAGPFKLYLHDSYKGWRYSSSDSLISTPNLDAKALLLSFIEEQRHFAIADFEEHLDDVTRDWLNAELLQ